MSSSAKVTPRIFRLTLEVSDLEASVRFYAELLGFSGARHPGARHYFDCGGVILAVLAPGGAGASPTLNAKSLYFSCTDLEGVHARAKQLGALASYQVHGASAAEIVERPWGERSFYVRDPSGNELCFVAEGTEYR